MSITIATYARIKAQERRPFRVLRTALARAEHSPLVQRRRDLENQHLHCQKGAAPTSTRECLDCHRFVSATPRFQSSQVRCSWQDNDPVEDVMTLASALTTVRADTSVADADRIARTHHIRHLLVLRDTQLVGVVCRCDLVEESYPGETVADRANHCPWIIGPSTTLGQAASLMSEKRIGILPVIDRRELVGVITRGDLRRVGVHESLLNTQRCSSCASTSGVRQHPLMNNVSICLECLDDANEPLDYQELGCG